MKILFWISLGIIVYTYLGYPIILYFFKTIKEKIAGKEVEHYMDDELPSICLLIACYNEGDFLEEKIKNTERLRYAAEKLSVCFVTDGTDDGSDQLIESHSTFKLFHHPERRGKNAAINRVLPLIKEPIIIFCDANTFLNTDALINIARHYKDPLVGAVAGEKRVYASEGTDTAGVGEGAYWKYESTLKKWDSTLHTVVGAAGELFSVRRELMPQVPNGILIEDFFVSMNIAREGYKVVYEPDSYAMETGSASIAEERKRKVRISAGGLQAVWYFIDLLNIFKYGWLSFQYISHRMLRWTLAPLSLVLCLLSTIYLVSTAELLFFDIILLAQILFYLVAALGYLLEGKVKMPGFMLLPFYFTFMNLSVYQGLIRLIKGSQSAVWEKAQRRAVSAD